MKIADGGRPSSKLMYCGRGVGVPMVYDGGEVGVVANAHDNEVHRRTLIGYVGVVTVEHVEADRFVFIKVLLEGVEVVVVDVLCSHLQGSAVRLCCTPDEFRNGGNDLVRVDRFGVRDDLGLDASRERR